MKSISSFSQFKSSALAKKLLATINRTKDTLCFMEVCGTHTVQIFKTGIKSGLAQNIQLISGPGCPVCVTSVSDIDRAIAIAKTKDVIMCCFGDMINVPGSRESLSSIRGSYGAQIRIIYSPLEALALASKNPAKKIVLLGVGFETTVPAFAAALIRAKKQRIKNIFIFPVFKLIPPALRSLLESPALNIDGFILPGHVSAIIGEKKYCFIAREFHKPAVITGFEVVDLLQGILLLVTMLKEKRPAIRNEYSRSVSPQGNVCAQKTIDAVFQKADVEWRGIGFIKKSGLKLNREFSDFDYVNAISIDSGPSRENPHCLCGNVIKGVNEPKDCLLFAKQCRPEHPIGPCMVSIEGTCSTHYRYLGAK